MKIHNALLIESTIGIKPRDCYLNLFEFTDLSEEDYLLLKEILKAIDYRATEYSVWDSLINIEDKELNEELQKNHEVANISEFLDLSFENIELQKGSLDLLIKLAKNNQIKQIDKGSEHSKEYSGIFKTSIYEY